MIHRVPVVPAEPLPGTSPVRGDIDPFLMKPVPIESSRRDLSIGTGFVKIGGILRKLWSKQMGVSRCVTKNVKTIVLRTMKKVLRTMKKSVTHLRQKCRSVTEEKVFPPPALPNRKKTASF